MKILIVDDSRAARMLISSLIKEYNENIQIIEAENGQIAVELHRSQSPDMTFLDLTMPVMNGFEALEMILKENPQSKVVVLTADFQQKAIDRCQELGAYKVIRKLPDKDAISGIIREIQDLNG